MTIYDLGCGGNLHEGAIGIDIVGKPATRADIVCNLGFEDIPAKDNSADRVIAHHFIEHVPFAVWQPPRTRSGKWERLLPMVHLFNEVYRILKHNGVFEITVPIAVNPLNGQAVQQMWQDPTHVSEWTPESIRYWSGDYYGFHNVYGHTSRFELVKIDAHQGWVMNVLLRAVKNLPDDYPFMLEYTK